MCTLKTSELLTYEIDVGIQDFWDNLPRAPIISIIGLQGQGKSHFLNLLSKTDSFPEGSGALRPQTVGIFAMQISNPHLIFLDVEGLLPGTNSQDRYEAGINQKVSALGILLSNVVILNLSYALLGRPSPEEAFLCQIFEIIASNADNASHLEKKTILCLIRDFISDDQNLVDEAKAKAAEMIENCLAAFQTVPLNLKHLLSFRYECVENCASLSYNSDTDSYSTFSKKRASVPFREIAGKVFACVQGHNRHPDFERLATLWNRVRVIEIFETQSPATFFSESRCLKQIEAVKAFLQPRLNKMTPSQRSLDQQKAECILMFENVSRSTDTKIYNKYKQQLVHWLDDKLNLVREKFEVTTSKQKLTDCLHAHEKEVSKLNSERDIDRDRILKEHLAEQKKRTDDYNRLKYKSNKQSELNLAITVRLNEVKKRERELNSKYEAVIGERDRLNLRVESYQAKSQSESKTIRELEWRLKSTTESSESEINRLKIAAQEAEETVEALKLQLEEVNIAYEQLNKQYQQLLRGEDLERKQKREAGRKMRESQLYPSSERNPPAGQPMGEPRLVNR
jgi:hypothetical protein